MDRLSVTASNVVEEVFNLILGQNVDVTGQMWTYNIPVLSSNEKKFVLEFQTISTMVLGYVGTDFPQQIKVLCTNAAGFKDHTGAPTTVVATLSPSTVVVKSNSGIDQWSVLYTMDGKDVAWELGANRTIAFMLTDDANRPISLPISNGLVTVFRILHISM